MSERCVPLRKRLSLIALLLILSILSLMPLGYAYHNSEYGFSITPPTGWGTVDAQGVAIAFGDPSVATTGASINVATEETRVAFSQYVAGSKTTLSTTLNNYNIVSEGSLVVNGLDCYSIVSTWTQNNIDFKAEQVIFVENGRAYVITCASFVSQFGNVFAYFLPSIDSFQIDSASTTPTDSASLTESFSNSSLVAAIAIIAVVIIAVVAVMALFFLKKRQQTESDGNRASTSPATTVAHNGDTSDNTPRFCRYCGEKTKNDSVFCDNCGKQLS